VTATQLRIEYHPASDGNNAKTPDDFVTIDLKSHKIVALHGLIARRSAMYVRRRQKEARSVLSAR
jgi:hypothetical protein